MDIIKKEDIGGRVNIRNIFNTGLFARGKIKRKKYQKKKMAVHGTRGLHACFFLAKM